MIVQEGLKDGAVYSKGKHRLKEGRSRNDKKAQVSIGEIGSAFLRRSWILGTI